MPDQEGDLHHTVRVASRLCFSRASIKPLFLDFGCGSIKVVAYLDGLLKWIAALGVDTKKIRVTNEDMLDKKEQQVLALTYQIIVKFLKIDEVETERHSDREGYRQRREILSFF